MKISAVTDAGLIRHNNEDYLFHDSRNRLAIVADGVGGHEYGEVASRIAVESCHRYLVGEQHLSGEGNVRNALTDSLKYANQQILAHKKKAEGHENMGTTLTCFHVRNSTLHFAYIGDSRLYLIDSRDKEIHQLTTDHTVYQEMLDKGLIPEVFKKNILTRMLGSNLHIRPAYGCVSVREGDFVLACTDGLSDLIRNGEMLKSILQNPDADAAAQNLVDLAKGQGGRDNITVVLVRVERDECAG